MLLTRCDVCCDVLDGIDYGVVYDCSKEVHDNLRIEHICEECLKGSDDLFLTNPAQYCYVVEFKGEKKMNNFNITVNSEPFFPPNHYGTPVVIVDEIKLEPKTVSTQIDAQAPMHVLKDIAAQQLSKKIVDLMNHRSISDLSSNLHYEEFSFTYAEKDQLDILRQELESRTEQYLSACEDLNESQEHIAYIMNRYIEAKNYLKITKAIIVLISTLAIADLTIRFM